jgi:hypothetical protein
MGTPWTSSQKDLDPADHLIVLAKNPTGTFVPPHPLPLASFHSPDLVKSIARCIAMKRSSAGLTAALIASNKPLIEHLVEDTTSTLAFIDEVEDLADAERSALSGRVGVGIADLFMEAMKVFIWRDVAEQLIRPTKLGGKLADFIYETTAGDFVIVEAKGSITSAASQSGADSRAKRAFNAQVEPYIYGNATSTAGSSFGWIDHGYAVAFEGLPGPLPPAALLADAFLAVAEPDRLSSAAPAQATGGSTAAHAGSGAGVGPSAGAAVGSASTKFLSPLRLGNYRAAFLLANAPNIVSHIDALLSRSEPPTEVQGFWTVTCDNEKFLIGREPRFPEMTQLIRGSGWLFAIGRSSANHFLAELAVAGQGTTPQQLIVDPVFERDGRPFVRSRDGLAMLRSDTIKVTGEVEWRPKQRTLIDVADSTKVDF